MTVTEPELIFQFKTRLKQVSIYPVIGTYIISASVLLGWQFDVEFLKRIIPGLVAMNPITAVCFILAGTAIILISKNRNSENSFSAPKILAILITLTCLSCLITNLLNIEDGIDHWLFTGKLNDEVNNVHNRMAPNTAFNFITLGISLFLLSNKEKRSSTLSQYFILVIILISLLSIIGYIYGVRSFYGVLTYIPMAIHTSFCFLLLSSSALLSTCDKGFMADFTSNYVGSIIARKLILPVIIIPVLLGFIIIYGEKSGLYVTHFGTALFTAANILVFAYLIKKIQTSVNKADIARTDAEKKLLELNLQLEEKTASLQVLNNELESFSYSISHDLKAPLRAIQGYTTILIEDQSDNLGEEGNRTANNIINNTKKMSQLIDDLLEFSRIRRKHLQSTDCNMNLMVQSILKEQYLDLKEKGYEIMISDLFPSSGDSKMIEQVWVNLISNALKYSGKKEKPLIQIGSYKENNENIYFVKDNGAGFDMKYINKLFGVFQRLHAETDFKGTGIGLAIVQRIVARHGGKVWAEAKLNEGANFYFSLPDRTQ